MINFDGSKEFYMQFICDQICAHEYTTQIGNQNYLHVDFRRKCGNWIKFEFKTASRKTILKEGR